MDKYKAATEEKLKGKSREAEEAELLLTAEFSNLEREKFFNGAYADIFIDYFWQFMQTEPHETKKREWIYTCIQALGDVKSQLIQYETRANNIKHERDNANV